jgi:hypothetical protein
VEQRNTVSRLFCVHRDRYRSVWLRPPDLPHPDGVLDAPLRRFVFVPSPAFLVSRHRVAGSPAARSKVAAGLPEANETPQPDGIRLLPVLRGRQYGLRTSAIPGGQWTSVCWSSYRVRVRIVRERSSSEVGRRSNRNRGHPPTCLVASTHSSGVLRNFWGWSRSRSVEDLPPVVLRRAWTRLLGRNRNRRSSLASFGTHHPSSNGPFRVRRTSADVIFG